MAPIKSSPPDTAAGRPHLAVSQPEPQTPMNAAPTAATYLLPILLLIGSNVFMTFACSGAAE